MVGYLHPGYAESLAEFGVPLLLPRCGGWLLKRQIAGFPDFDAMGCYPLFACRDWGAIRDDLDELRDALVSVALVADPFGEHTESLLRACFQDIVLPFKAHFVTDLRCAPDRFIHPHHRRNARKARRDVTVERCAEPARFVDDWRILYANLIRKYSIHGIPAFSRTAFDKQIAVPGLVMLRAVHDGATVGMTLWYAQGEVAYYHLGAYSDRGYELRASFALFDFALDYFAGQGLRWLNLGAGAGTRLSENDGLTRFKAGWATGTRTAYFCGRIFNRARYAEIVRARGVPATDYFPAYRVGEFG